MSRLLLVLTLLMLSMPASLACASQGDTLRLALVLGNNRPINPERPSLRYADDDAVATHQLLTEAGVDSVVLVTPDPDTRAFYPDQHYEPPTVAALEREIARLAKKVRVAARNRVPTELFLFYSGHGDVDNGEGFVLLEDDRLTRTGLLRILERVAADRNHVVIDSCKSYFLVFDRGLGGRRSSYTGEPLPQLIPGKLKNTGFVLSTSSDRESHEWDRYHGGIVSHELRSALRGSADVNLDGRISYAEVGAFLSKANEGIVSRYRPDVMVRPPSGKSEDALLEWKGEAPLQLHNFPSGHLYVEGPGPERLIDLHRPSGSSTFLWTPRKRPLFVRYHDDTMEYQIDDADVVKLEPAASKVPATTIKGGLHVEFERLFSSPFSAADVVSFDLSDAPEQGGLRLDVARRRRPLWASLATGAGTAALGAGLGLLVRALVLKHDSDAAVRRARATMPVDADAMHTALDRFDGAMTRRRGAMIVSAAGVVSLAAGLYGLFAR